MCPWNHPDRFTFITSTRAIYSEFSANAVLASKGTGCRVEVGLEVPECHRLETLLVKTIVVSSSPADEGKGTNDSSQFVSHWEVSKEESSRASFHHVIILLLGVEVSGTEFTLVIKEQVLGVVDFLKELGRSIVFMSDHFHLAVKAPHDLFTTSEVMNILETFTVLDVC